MALFPSMTSDLLAIAEHSIRSLASRRGNEYAMAAARIAFGGIWASGITRLLSELPEDKHPRAEQLLEGLAHILSNHAQVEAILLTADAVQLTADGLAIADDVDLGSKTPAAGVH